jgi:hypothetical protein
MHTGTVVLALLVMPISLASQAPPGEAPSRSGDWTISFAIAGLLTGGAQSSGTFGLSRMVSGRLALGLGMSLAKTSNSTVLDETAVPPAEFTSDSLRHRLGPIVKWYLGPGRAVRPFLETSIGRQWDRGTQVFRGDTVAESRGAGWDILAAIGAEWSPAAWVGISGQTGYRYQRSRTETEGGSGFFAPPLSTRKSTSLTSFTSLLLLHLYF